ncbi:hypothetical protein [Litorimonas sp. WD9-15]|uniref:hypothetical protein n=1 Tax=Litorimonas sp. WD9-15 TaxID=3418716 RepID=UPI003CFE5B91
MIDLDETLRAVSTVLAVSALIDERLRDIEMIEFSHSVMTINQRIRPGVILPRKTVVKWFKDNEDEITVKISEDENSVWRKEILSLITDPELRRLVLSAMFSISVCDYELDDEECEFLKLAVSLWETGLPSVADVELMVV